MLYMSSFFFFFTTQMVHNSQANLPSSPCSPSRNWPEMHLLVWLKIKHFIKLKYY